MPVHSSICNGLRCWLVDDIQECKSQHEIGLGIASVGTWEYQSIIHADRLLNYIIVNYSNISIKLFYNKYEAEGRHSVGTCLSFCSITVQMRCLELFSLWNIIRPRRLHLIEYTGLRTSIEHNNSTQKEEPRRKGIQA